MIKSYIRIRFLQIYRALSAIGPIRILVLMVLLFIAGVFLFALSSQSPNSFYFAAGTLLLILSVQIKRQDKVFMKTITENYAQVWFVEYLLLSFPTLILLLIHFQWMPVLILFSGLAAIPFIDYQSRKSSLNTWLQRRIPDACFEWKSGVRKTIYFIVPLWLIGFFTSFFIGSVPVMLLILGIIPFAFYEKGEPWQMITSFEKGINRFLLLKIKLLIGMFSILALPLIAAFLVFHTSVWYIPVIIYFVFISLYIFLILTKYAFYEPNSKSPAAQTIGAIGVICGMIPLFLPIVWFLSLRFWFKSVENLKIYLNDFDS